MAVSPQISDVIAEMRSRVGDDITGNYFFTDAQWTAMIKTAERKLPDYQSVEDEDENDEMVNWSVENFDD